MYTDVTIVYTLRERKNKTSYISAVPYQVPSLLGNSEQFFGGLLHKKIGSVKQAEARYFLRLKAVEGILLYHWWLLNVQNLTDISK